MANRRLLIEVVSVLFLACGAAEAADLERGFRSPPDAARPWAYWWWLKGNVTKRSITRDLEEMKNKGIGGLLLFDARGYHEGHVPPPASRMEFMSAAWRGMLKHAMAEASRLGLEMSVNLSSCAGALKGPWTVGEDAPRKLVWAAREVRGPKRLRLELPRGDWGRFRHVAVVAARRADDRPAAGAPANATVTDVVDLAGKVDSRQRLAWDAPQGRWVLLRFACVIMPGHDSDVDILSAKAVAGHFKRMGGALIEDAGPLAGKTLTHFYSVSWEGAAPTWTPGLGREFKRRRGYDLRPFLPALAGLTVRSRDVTDRFLRDYHKTLGDCFMDHCYGTLRRLCGRSGMKWHSESGGPWNRKRPSFRHADQLAFLGRNDMPQGEFWLGGRAMNRPAAMAARIYGRPMASTEAFTHMRAHWSAYPALLKPDADAAFCDGINRFIWHTFTASPAEFGRPGIEYFAGTHLNPNVTWWHAAGPFLAYLARCQFLLRRGRFVSDVCCYTGDSPYQHWGRGEKWSPRATLTLGRGYTYDLINTEVLLERLAVKEGRLALPEAARYRVLVVDLEDETAPPRRTLRKITELVKAGATVVLGRRRPVRAPGLRDYPACDDEVRRLAEPLWGEPGRESARRSLGKGKVVSPAPLDEALRAEGVRPDFVGPWDYAHRRDGDADIYFLAGAGQAECTFRVKGKEPELWDPKTGSIRDAVCWRPTGDGRTVVPIRLPENGSVFVVYRKPARKRHVASAAGPDGGLEIAGRSDLGARVHLWKKGRYGLRTSAGKQIAVEARDLPEPLALTGPWRVRFAPGWGAPEAIAFDKLIAWDKHSHDGIRHFSGTATYRKTFDASAEQAGDLVRLRLGEVRHVARVRVNGKDMGVVWTAPWTVDLTGVVKPGPNKLEIDVTNLWVNRLIGDAALPKAKRLTRTNVRLKAAADRGFRHFMGFTAKDALVPSGLLGPVLLEFGRQRDVRF